MPEAAVGKYVQIGGWHARMLVGWGKTYRKCFSLSPKFKLNMEQQPRKFEC
jgi:hypothetical protein